MLIIDIRLGYAVEDFKVTIRKLFNVQMKRWMALINNEKTETQFY